MFDLELDLAVSYVDDCGSSGIHIGYKWYYVYLVNGDHFSFYCKD